MRRAILRVLAIAGLGASMGFLPQFGSTTHSLGELAAMRVPRKARLDTPRLTTEQAEWVGFRADRYHTWAMGSSTPYRASLFINLHAAGASPSSYGQALDAAERSLNGGADGWAVVERGGAWEIGQGRYTVNMLNEATWRLKYRDPARRVSALWQVYQKDWSLPDARAALVRMVESVERKREADYKEIADRPRRAAEEGARKHAAAMAWLAQRGFAPLTPGVPVTRDGITVEYMAEPERRIMLYKPLAARPTTRLPAFASHGWRVWADSGWENTMSNNDYYPMPGTRRQLDQSQARPGPHHFMIRTIRLDELDESDYYLAEFFELATGVR